MLYLLPRKFVTNTAPNEVNRANETADFSGQTTGPWRTVWRPGDEHGQRRFVSVGDLALERGGMLPNVVVCYEMYGELNADKSNAVLVLHGFTADSHGAGPTGPGHPEAGWWDGVIGPGKGIDTNKFCVIVPNALGGCQGTTGPAQLAEDGKPWGSRWPVTTIRDMVAAERLLADELGIETWHGAVGVSLGGMRALEWAVGSPERVARAVIIGVGSQATAEQIAYQAIQMEIITSDPEFHGGDYYDKGDGRGPVRGMALARKLGHLTYRSEIEMHQRFGNRPEAGEEPLSPVRGSGRFGVMSYLDYAGVRLERRFDPNTYLAINEAMNMHDIGRDRGGVNAAMRRITAELTVAGMEEDRLYPIRLQKMLVAEAPRTADLHIVRSAVGHDAFLTEDTTMSALIAPALA
jgi:homoserine O-acetyltransferase/O-succinyltransferase